jgi:hypothetical protein
MLLPFSSCEEDLPETEREKVGGIHGSEGDVTPSQILMFDGQEVGFDEFRYYYLNYKNMYLSENPDHFEAEGAEEALKEEIINCLRDTFSIRALAKEHKIKLTKAEKATVKKEIEKAIEAEGGQDNFEAMLESSFMTEDLYTYMMEYSALYLKVFNTLYRDGGKEAWSDKEFFDFYRKHYVAVQEIMIPYQEGESKENHPETKKEADGIYQKAAKGEDFWSLIESYGKDETMLDYPDGYYFTEGQAEDALWNASKSLEINQISEPIPAESGLYIIKRLELKEGRMNENRSTALFGYTDTLGTWHPGAYDEKFEALYQEKGEKIKIEYTEFWDMISTQSVF